MTRRALSFALIVLVASTAASTLPAPPAPGPTAGAARGLTAAPAPGPTGSAAPAPTAVAAREDGYRLWLRYDRIVDAEVLARYRTVITGVRVAGASPTLDALRRELAIGLSGLLGLDVSLDADAGAGVLVGTPDDSPEVAVLLREDDRAAIRLEGFVLRTVGPDGRVLLAANTHQGLLYAAFRLLSLLQTHQPLDGLDLVEAPRVDLRILNHWDNLDRTVERGYAGFSLWDWHRLPDYRPDRYRDYARANASIGINGSVLTNVNANAVSLTRPWLEKAAALADEFRPYGIRVYLTARFSAPIEIGGLETADPLDPEVRAWWRAKADEVYGLIPDFGGFLVKANSEGQPGPQDYGRSHAEGANLLAEALAPHGGVVMWRAFVYSHEVPDDRAKQAFTEFTPLDGVFAENVFVQVKNGPIDFQPREPFHPLFGAMPRTPLMMEFQVTKEYLGLATHLVYLAPQYREVLASDTRTLGMSSTVARVVDGTLHGLARSGMAGVSNVGTDHNWCGSVFACANWYAFGRLAWDHSMPAEEIAGEWLRRTFTTDEAFVEPVMGVMMGSWQAAVDYMTPLGLHHLMARHHHYGPGPWVDGGRPDWTSVYYHRADSVGIGFDRSPAGSDAVSQYASPVAERFGDPDTVPEDLLLWFHHVPWDRPMPGGRTLWDELALRYQSGVDAVRAMRETWERVGPMIDETRYRETATFLAIQEREAAWWRDASLLYFQTFSGRPLPEGVEAPARTLEEYMNHRDRYVPGIRDEG
jgi:alpha-glucuronidase